MSTAILPQTEQQKIRAGIIWMLVGTLFFVITDILARYLTQSYPVLQVVWARFFFHLLLMTVFWAPSVPKFVMPNNIWAALLRAGLVFLTTTGSVATVQLIPVANMHAIALLSPMIVTLVSISFLGEKIQRGFWAAVSIAFLGAILIVRPGSGVFQAGSILCLITIVVYSVGNVAATYAKRFDDTATILYLTALVGGVLSSFFMPFVWQQPDFSTLMLMVLLGALSGAGHCSMIKAFGCGHAAKVAPFNYFSVIWATIGGLVAFREFPDIWTISGAGIILFSTTRCWKLLKS